MQTSQIGGAASTGQSALSEQMERNSMDKQAFLQLLVTQLRHQDPMDPLKQEEYAAQLAQFSSVEQLTNLNERFDQMYQSNIQLNRSISNTMATQLVGRQVRAMGNSIRYSDQDPIELSYNLRETARNVTISIKDSSGNTVRTEELGYRHAGESSFIWDGQYDNGQMAVEGAAYTYEIEATGTDGEPVEAYSFVQGEITGVEYGSGGRIYFLMGDHRISAGDVQRIYDGG